MREGMSDTIDMFEQYYQAVQQLESLIGQEHGSYMDREEKGELDWAFYLRRTQRLFDELGKPERQLKYIHIAGTAGKGSTAAFVYQGLVEDGRAAGLFTSPHVTTSLERIQVDGQLVDPELFAEVVPEVVRVAKSIQEQDAQMMPSYSEVFFAVAVICFVRSEVEYAVVETGCGGRYDKTNIIPAPEITLITNVSYDHLDLLGDTREQIAEHKAGVIKPGTTIYSTEEKSEVQAVFNTEAQQYGLEVHYLGGRPPERGSHGAGQEMALAMAGSHQQRNAALAAAALSQLGVSGAVIRQAFRQVRLPARVELMQEEPRVILDGAHSIEKTRALAAALEASRPWNNLHLVLAVKERPDLARVIEPLVKMADTITLTTFHLIAFSSTDPATVSEAVKQIAPNTEVLTETDSRTAVQTVLSKAKKSDLVVITGSLYLAGDVRRIWVPESDVLSARSCFPVFDK